MVEAVYSSVSTSTLIRSTAEQLSSAKSFATNPEKIQEAPQAPYVSPYIHVDDATDRVVIQIRNPDTGKVIEQIPSDPGTVQGQNRAPQVSQPEVQQTTQSSTPAASAASFGAFAKQVASLQAAITGGGTGGTVSISA